MVNKINELDQAQLRHEMRELYLHVGHFTSLQVLYEMMLGAQILSEVISEEVTKGND